MDSPYLRVVGDQKKKKKKEEKTVKTKIDNYVKSDIEEKSYWDV